MIVRDPVPAPFLGELLRMFLGLLKVFAMLDKLCALRAHGSILTAAVAGGNNDVSRHIKPSCRQRDRLAMIAAGSRDQSGWRITSGKLPVGIYDCGACLKCARWCVVFVLDPDLRPQTS